MSALVKEILAAIKVAGLFAQMQVIRASSVSPLKKAIKIHKLRLEVEKVVKETV